MNTDKIILGEDCVYSTDPKETGLNNNNIVFGPSGCGKTMSIGEALMLETFSRSLVVTCTKRRIVEKYKPLFKERGYEVYDLNFTHPENGDIGYDPLCGIKSYQDITHLAQSIVEADPRKKDSKADPYWDQAATSLLSAEIAYVLMTKKEPRFTSVLNMQMGMEINTGGDDKIIKTNYDDKFAAIAKKDPTNFAVTCWNTFKQLPISTASCVYSALNSTLDRIYSPSLRKMIEIERKLEFSSLADRKAVLFITTSPVNPSLHLFINMFYAHMFKALFEYAEEKPDGVLPVPVHVIADDFATGGRILNFAEYISIFREKRISVTLLLQSESQLETMYGAGDCTTIINNCDTYVYMGGMDLKTCSNISQRMNVPLDEILYMPIGKEILFRRGQRPVVTSRYNVCENETYKKVTAKYNKSILKK
ncbi:MAG: type IV secretory system conjugative DNA transfer family protein [Oscillospiraceae bacterium]|nr:type IV secretory system conjugative DNA transfer family protein [Oscillospiraceae bacterium]